MACIRFNLTRITDEYGRAIQTKINRMYSDLPSLGTIETNIIWNALSKAGKVIAWLKMDVGALDRDMLGHEETFALDAGMLNVDKLT